jgi:catechol 2,3-dioxygenase-like lactoylglutathione lyase family enzyme
MVNHSAKPGTILNCWHGFSRSASEKIATQKEIFMNGFPEEGMALTHILVVKDIFRSKEFYTKVLGGELFREYGGTSCVINFQGAWLLLVTGGGPTKDKPDIEFVDPEDTSKISHSMTIRVGDCQKSYEILKSRGAKFLTPPVDWEFEIRCFFKDPDGHLFEISQTK